MCGKVFCDGEASTAAFHIAYGATLNWQVLTAVGIATAMFVDISPIMAIGTVDAAALLRARRQRTCTRTDIN
jgi:hypothetical protein